MTTTTIEVPDELLQKAMSISRKSSPQRLIVKALEEYARRHDQAEPRDRCLHRALLSTLRQVSVRCLADPAVAVRASGSGQRPTPPALARTGQRSGSPRLPIGPARRGTYGIRHTGICAHEAVPAWVTATSTWEKTGQR